MKPPMIGKRTFATLSASSACKYVIKHNNNRLLLDGTPRIRNPRGLNELL